jgi:hypothetical protein
MWASETSDTASEAMLRGLRSAREAIERCERLQWSASFALTSATRESAFDCLRDLGCLPHWWPGARAIAPLPPGLCQPGDSAVLETRDGAVLLRVLSYRPRGRLVLALVEPDATLLLVDLALTCNSAGTEVRLGLETPRPTAALAATRAAVRLRLIGLQAAAALELHLAASPRHAGTSTRSSS